MTLRRQFIAAMVLVGVVGLTACLCLTAAAHVIHARVLDLSSTIDGIDSSEEVTALLVTHYRTEDPVVRASSAAALGPALAEARKNIQTPAEASLVAQLSGEVDRYLEAASDRTSAGPAFEAAVGTSFRLRALNVAQGRAAREQARDSDAWASRVAVAGSSFIVLALAGSLLWMRRSTFTPFVALEHGLRTFARGDYDTRVVEAGGSDARAMIRTFNRMAQAIVQSRRRQLKYVASVVNDLRNPLSALQLAVSILSPERAAAEVHLHEVVELVRRQVVRMNSIVGDLLNAARIEAGELVLKSAPYDIRAVAREVVDHFGRLAPGYILALDAPEAIVIDGDRARIEQVLNNLVSNAVKYSPAGTHVDVRIRPGKDECTIEVADQGRGFSPEECARIFDPFARSVSAHSEAGGAGLGLYSARRIVEAHGGRIDVKSGVDEGSTFSVHLPLVAPPSPAAAPPITIGLLPEPVPT